jgi:phosphate transport system substrate-binding protein
LVVGATMGEFRAIIAALLLLAAPSLAPAADMPSVHVRGSTIFLPAMQALAERYMTEHEGSRVVVLGGGSWWGVKTVLDGTASLGMISGEGLPPELAELAQDDNITLHRWPLGRFAVSPIVHPGNPVTNLSLAQLHDIYTGRIANWKDVGGPNQPIHIIASEDAMAGVFQVWSAKVMGNGVVSPKAITVPASQIDDHVARDPLAIGYTAQSRQRGTVKALTIGGVAPSRDSITDGRYPVTGDVAMAYREPLAPAAKAFLDYCRGEAGRAEMIRIQAIPLSKEEEEVR